MHTQGMSRRSALAAGAMSGAVLLADPRLAAEAASRRRAPVATGGTFAQGVLSGDPTPTAVTLWTRLGDVGRDLVKVRLEVARDPDFKRVVQRRLVATGKRRDHTVKVRVTGLKPDTRYWYRFATKGASSPVGRTQTAPAVGSDRVVKLGFFSCQAYTAGHFGAYQRLLAEDCDFVLCLGDYVYERLFSGYDKGVGRVDRVGANGDGDVRTLDEYRAKYRLYREDPDLKALHAQVPFVSMWDDHEVEDNYVGGDENSDDNDPPRRAAGWQAYFEYQPCLQFRGAGERFRTYRSLRYGKHVDLLLTDQRQYRDDQPCGDAMFTRCSASKDPRDYLGRAQMEWLKGALTASKATWKLIGNQLMVMPFDVAAGIPVTVDSWEGYQAERSELLGTIADRGVQNVTFLTGDIHTFFAGRVLRDGRSGPAVATELVGGSTTSPGTAEVIGETAGGIPPDLARALTDNVRLTNPWFDYAETRSHGFATVEAGPDALRSTYYASRDVTTREGSADVRVLQRFLVPNRLPDVQPV